MLERTEEEVHGARVRGASGKYMVDYWGLSFKQAAQALNARLAAEASGRRPAGRIAYR